ncbi:hypothetical protein BDD14_6494 [Edaphobacter modestus]|uniref:Uncharacterized protein n=2 Tax=Edaphobacter modestus TaxID=388466 RepID=A0A4Q7XYR4_9BACT|nr:hypothetical protein BDD14_6494 [Edaphobacter modestus]
MGSLLHVGRVGVEIVSTPGFDFKVTIPCTHSECSGSHALLVRVVEKTGEVLAKSHGEEFSAEQMYTAPHPALFGNGPKNTFWQMPHGAGGGVEAVAEWVPNASQIWAQAAND